MRCTWTMTLPITSECGRTVTYYRVRRSSKAAFRGCLRRDKARPPPTPLLKLLMTASSRPPTPPTHFGRSAARPYRPHVPCCPAGRSAFPLPVCPCTLLPSLPPCRRRRRRRCLGDAERGVLRVRSAIGRVHVSRCQRGTLTRPNSDPLSIRRSTICACNIRHWNALTGE